MVKGGKEWNEKKEREREWIINEEQDWKRVGVIISKNVVIE